MTTAPTSDPATDKGVLIGVAFAAVLVLTSTGEFAWAVLAGWSPWVAWAWPLAVDLWAVQAFRARRDVPFAMAVIGTSVALAHVLPAVYSDRIEPGLIPSWKPNQHGLPYGWGAAAGLAAAAIFWRIDVLRGVISGRRRQAAADRAAEAAAEQARQQAAVDARAATAARQRANELEAERLRAEQVRAERQEHRALTDRRDEQLVAALAQPKNPVIVGRVVQDGDVVQIGRLEIPREIVDAAADPDWRATIKGPDGLMTKYGWTEKQANTRVREARRLVAERRDTASAAQPTAADS
jgi:hypothetical protein